MIQVNLRLLEEDKEIMIPAFWQSRNYVLLVNVIFELNKYKIIYVKTITANSLHSWGTY